ncbi:ABC transporter permease subunit [Suttonella ornithocola]|uniref:ABC-type transport system involved in multi-copper enzyme maturation, permease component n=1 Tax=Suttonella ornithocola TaxID=279832 RepID=A0A380MQD0_9GAMM|nr:ABC transporter permease subunit [Suttonella ornithocola]SUO94488.1 ABC-type transport system involved in multi-copper enzyme maturation, permease component [Suttonella ornithocola]
MNNLFPLAQKEFTDGIRNRWVLAITLLLTIFALSLVALGSAPVGEVKTSPLAIIIVSLASLNIFLLPLIALLLSYDSLVGEIENGTMPLLLVYPLSRSQIVLGKFIGQWGILAVATLIAYGITAIAVFFIHRDIGYRWITWQPFVLMTLSTIALGGVFLAIGTLLSAIARQRTQAAGMAIGVWLLFVLVYDLALLGALLLDKKHWITERMLSWLMWGNPADAYRLLNIGSGENATVAGMLNVGQSMALSPMWLVISLVIWMVIPVLLTILIFRKKTP